ncbi:GNAT family N-acetyltransferase [Thalassotalea sediminis]|uniref:GNAT family N-acetyltransferase n=1 Tax=Thalassotalea sediminis TaxID=1759089 RepID=UPI0025735086|nr:GNAT family N-acetyltransferase [Thalassotalea sediminis]
MELISLTEDEADAFSDFYLDFAKHDPDNAAFYLPGFKNFSLYLSRLEQDKQGLNLPKGSVPCSHFWLRKDGGRLLGAIRVRHHINTPYHTYESGHIGYDVAPSYRNKGIGKSMLRLAFNEAKQLGLNKLLIVADKENIASCRVIEANNGTLESVVIGKVYPKPLKRYWCQL